MFDITSWIRETIFRRPKLGRPIAGEELSEKKTTKMGYFLLICMFGAIISTATWSLGIIRSIPHAPKYPSQCISDTLSDFGISLDEDGFYSYGYYSQKDDCILIGTHPSYNMMNAYNALGTGQIEIRKLRADILEKSHNASRLESLIREQKNEYNTSLTEKIAGETNLSANTITLRNAIQENQKNLDALTQSIREYEKKLIIQQDIYQPQVQTLKNLYEKAVSDYDHEYLWYKITIALLSLLFSGLIFWVFYSFYVRNKTKNSPQTIIFSVATFAYGIVLLYVLLGFLWDLIPHTLLEIFLGWISLFTPLLFLVQFFWPIIVVAVFGFLVYRIQKRLYAPENILKRFISDEKCPNCGNAVDITKPFCPLCAHEIQIHCPHCKALTIKGMPHCASCGKDIS